jgi:hypothetical protein
MFVRTTIAIAITLYSYKLAHEKKLYSFIFTVLVAASIHTSALMALPVYYLYNAKISFKKFLIILLIIVPVFVSFGSVLFENFTFLGDHIYTKINKYAELPEHGGGMTRYVALRNHIIKRILLLSLLVLFLKKDIIYNNKLRGLVNIYFYSSVVYLSLVPISLQFSRLTGYFEMVDIFLFAYIADKPKDKLNKVLLMGCLILFALLKFRSNINRYYEIYTNYEFVFSGMFT